MKNVKVGDTLYVTRGTYGGLAPVEITEHIVTRVNTASIYTNEKNTESKQEYRFNKKGELQVATFDNGQAYTTLEELETVQKNRKLEADLRVKLQKVIQTADLETLIELDKLI